MVEAYIVASRADPMKAVGDRIFWTRGEASAYRDSTICPECFKTYKIVIRIVGETT